MGGRAAAWSVVAAAAVLLAGGAAASGRSAGSSSVILGKIHLGTREIGLAGACSAIATGPSAIGWNPAGLADTERTSVEVLHVEQGESVRIENVLAAQPLLRGLVVGGSASYLNQPPLPEIAEINGEPVATGRDLAAYQYKGALGVAQALAGLGDVETLGEIWSKGAVGAAVNVLGERIGGAGGVSAALDLGYRYEDANEGRSAALVVRDLGTPVRGRPIPVAGQAGFGQRIADWNFSMDFLTAVDDVFRLRAGVEWTYTMESGGVTLRGGAQHSFSSDLIAPLAAGLGYRFALPGGFEFTLEYAWSPVRGFSDLQAASIRVAL